MLLVGQQVAHDVMSSLSLATIFAEVKLADEEVTYGPDPLRTLMVVMTSCLIVVVVVTLVLIIQRI